MTFNEGDNRRARPGAINIGAGRAALLPKSGGHRPAPAPTPPSSLPRIGDPMTLTWGQVRDYIDHDPNAAPVPGQPAPAPGMPKPARQGLHKLSGAMRIEKLDPKHRQAEDLIALFEWIEANPHLQRELFFPWIDKQTPEHLRDIWRWYNPKMSEEELRVRAEAFNKGVAYLGASNREAYRVVVSEGRLRWKGGFLNTTGSTSGHGGADSYIWVLDRENTLFTGKHDTGLLHHSSFTAGAAIKGAGEWVVVDGVLREISGRTGHYKIPKHLFLVALRALHVDKGIPMHNVTVRVFRGEKEERLSCQAFLSFPGPYELFPAKPNTPGGGYRA